MVCKQSSDICQVFKNNFTLRHKTHFIIFLLKLRLDFSTFVITGPSTLTETIGQALFGLLTGGGAGTNVRAATQCATDTFTVTGGKGGNSPPVICGTNSNQHSKFLQSQGLISFDIDDVTTSL